MMGRWSSIEESLLVENLELGHDLVVVSDVLGRTPSDVVFKMVQLYHQGAFVVLAGPTFDAFVERLVE